MSKPNLNRTTASLMKKGRYQEVVDLLESVPSGRRKYGQTLQLARAYRALAESASSEGSGEVRNQRDRWLELADSHLLSILGDSPPNPRHFSAEIQAAHY